MYNSTHVKSLHPTCTIAPMLSLDIHEHILLAGLIVKRPWSFCSCSIPLPGDRVWVHCSCHLVLRKARGTSRLIETSCWGYTNLIDLLLHRTAGNHNNYEMQLNYNVWLQYEDLLLRQLGRSMATADQHHPKPRNKVISFRLSYTYRGTAQPSLAPRPSDHTVSHKCVWKQGVAYHTVCKPQKWWRSSAVDPILLNCIQSHHIE